MDNFEYKCTECDASVRKGDKFCPNCGRTLEWPEETETSVVEVKETKRSSASTRVDPAAVRALTDSSIGLSIAILLCCNFGIIIGIILLVQQSGVKKWLHGLQNPDYYLGIPTDTMLRKVRTISSCCVWAIVLTVIMSLVELGSVTGASSSTYNSSAAGIAIFGLILSGVGIACASVLNSKATAIQQSAQSGKTFKINRNRM